MEGLEITELVKEELKWVNEIGAAAAGDISGWVMSHLAGKSTEEPALARGKDGARVRAIHAALAQLFVSAARINADGIRIQSLCGELGVSAAVSEALSAAYTAQVAEVRAALQHTHTGVAHMVDMDWRLDYAVRSSSLSRLGEPMYFVSLTTAAPADVRNAGAEAGQTSCLNFACSVEQLQDMVFKLQDAVRQLETVAEAPPF